MPMSPQERSALNAALANAVDALQAELEAYRILLFVFLAGSEGPDGMRQIFERARSVIKERTLLNISPEEAERQRAATLASLDGLEQDLSEIASGANRPANEG